MTTKEKRHLSYSKIIHWRSLERYAERLLSDIKIYSKYGYENLPTSEDKLAYESKAAEFENILNCINFHFGRIPNEISEESHIPYMDYAFAKEKLIEMQDYWKTTNL